MPQITKIQVGVVVIGRNEGARLTRCLASVQKYLPAVVYVDSGSSDGSQALASSLGIPPLELGAARRADRSNFPLQRLPAVERQTDAVVIDDNYQDRHKYLRGSNAGAAYLTMMKACSGWQPDKRRPSSRQLHVWIR